MYILVSRFIDSKGYFDNIRANWNTRVKDALALSTSKIPAEAHYDYETPPMLDIGSEHLDFWDDGEYVIMNFVKSKLVLVYKNTSGYRTFAGLEFYI